MSVRLHVSILLSALLVSSCAATGQKQAAGEIDPALAVVYIGPGRGNPLVNGEEVTLAKFDERLREVAEGDRVCVMITRDRVGLPMTPALFQLFRTAEAAKIKVAFRSMGDCVTRGFVPMAANAGEAK